MNFRSGLLTIRYFFAILLILYVPEWNERLRLLRAEFGRRCAFVGVIKSPGITGDIP